MKTRFLIDKTVENKLRYKDKVNVEVNWYDYKITIPIYKEYEQASLWNVKCPSCNQYFPWSHPEHWYRMCEDCIW